jgi:hypothetical protein
VVIAYKGHLEQKHRKEKNLLSRKAIIHANKANPDDSQND